MQDELLSPSATATKAHTLAPTCMQWGKDLFGLASFIPVNFSATVLDFSALCNSLTQRVAGGQLTVAPPQHWHGPFPLLWPVAPVQNCR